MEKLCNGSHINIIKIFQHGRLRPESAFYFIDMELCDLNLDEYLRGAKRIPGLAEWKKETDQQHVVPLIYPIMDQITSGLSFIHSHKEVHRDLNPQNGDSPHISLVITSVIYDKWTCMEDC
jgi:serine/threonine protein kinase